MAKEAKTHEVRLRNDWYNGGRLLRVTDNPHQIPDARLDEVPSSAKIKNSDDKFVPIDEVRGQPESEKKDEAAVADKVAFAKKAADEKAAADNKAAEDKAAADAAAKKADSDKLKL